MALPSGPRVIRVGLIDGPGPGESHAERVESEAEVRAAVNRDADAQFREDGGPLAHPVQPDHYITIDNFYTATIYNKGAEVIRMMATIIGRDAFRRGMDLYFARHDNQAVTIDDFAQAMQDASGVDLTRFKRWYHRLARRRSRYRTATMQARGATR